MKVRRAGAVLAAAAAVVTLAAACSSGSGGSGSSSSSGSGASGNGSTIKVGVLTSITGSSASGFTPGTENGIKARLGLANAAGGVNGHKITYVMADDQSSPAGAATAVKKLIQQDHVQAILDVSSWFFGGYQAAVQAGIPVFGVGFDAGPEWSNPSYTGMFDINGSSSYTLVSSVYGKIAKTLGVTKAGALAYSNSPSAQESANGFVASATNMGMTKGYQTNIAFGSTDIGPVVLGIKNSGTNGFYTPVIPNTAFALLVGLAQAGVKMKMVLLATGYGGDLLASKAALAAGDGAYFYTTVAPLETGNAGARKLQDALHTYAGIAAGTEPGFANYQAWLAGDALVAALGTAGQNPTSASIISGFRNATWDAGGLYPQPINFSESQNSKLAAPFGPGGCVYVVQLKSGAFHPVQGLNPVCGDPIQGLTISP